jgi:hypothetical protein
MSNKKKEDSTTAIDLINCGNCGRRIRDGQPSVAVLNTRYKGYEYYHESYIGCYESTRESGKRRIMHRDKPWLNRVYETEHAEQSQQHWSN